MRDVSRNTADILELHEMEEIMCKHKNVQVSMFTTFNHIYFAMCMDCGEELILQPPKLRTTATVGKPTDIKTSDTRKRCRK